MAGPTRVIIMAFSADSVALFSLQLPLAHMTDAPAALLSLQLLLVTVTEGLEPWLPRTCGAAQPAATTRTSDRSR